MQGIRIVKQDITKLKVDIVVNAANEWLKAGGGVCGAIFHAAGAIRLTRACKAIGHCYTGDVAITPAFQLKAKNIIHAVGPIWKGGNNGEAEQLYSCYVKSLDLMREKQYNSIAFPLISAGIFGYPAEKAWEIAIRACHNYIKEHPDTQVEIVFAVIDENIYEMGNKILSEKMDEK